MNLTIFIFLIVYLAMGLGKIPGFKVDRTGAAVVGAMAMLAVGTLSSQAAWDAINYKTVGLLFGLMVISGAFAVSGFYAWTAQKVATLKVAPSSLLAVFILVSGFLSSILTNDVVVVAMTPLLVSITLARGLNPIPFLLGFCFAANTGSVGTLIGSPQNMIIAQALDISFVELLKIAGPPALVSLPIVWLVINLLYKNRWFIQMPTSEHAQVQQQVINVGDTVKAAVVMLTAVVLFIIDIWPQEVVALTAAGVLLLSRSTSSSDILKEVDGKLLLLIMGLFVVNAALATTGLPQGLLADLNEMGINLNRPIDLYFSGAALSNIIGNNPTAMLLVPYLHKGVNADALAAALVIGTGFACNLFIFSSLAGIVVVEQAKASGVTISFLEFTKAGGLVAIICIIASSMWIYFISS